MQLYEQGSNYYHHGSQHQEIMYYTDIRLRDIQHPVPDKAGFLATGLTRRNSGHSHCIALFPKFISNESAQMSDPSKLSFESSPVLLHDRIPVLVNLAMKSTLTHTSETCSTEKTRGCIPGSLTTASSEAPSLSAQLSSETSVEPSFLVNKFLNIGAIQSASAYAAIVPTAMKPTKKKYKAVVLKVRPVLAELPDKFCIIRNIIGDPLAGLPILDLNPGPFKPCGRYTEERKKYLTRTTQASCSRRKGSSCITL